MPSSAMVFPRYAWLLAIAVPISGSDEAAWKRLWETKRCFELAEARPQGLYEGLAAAVFHDEAKAVDVLEWVIRQRPQSADALLAHNQLLYLHQRAGRMGKALAHLRAMASSPALKRGSLGGAAALFEAFAGLPDLRVTNARKVSSTFERDDEGLWIPIQVGGKSTKAFLDTGANFSMISRQLAQSLGVPLVGGRVESETTTTQKAVMQLAALPALDVAGLRVENNAALVLDDEAQPFSGWPIERRLVLGLPVILSLGAWTFSNNGSLRIDPSPAPLAEKPNLCFSGATPLLEGMYQGKRLLFAFDTGAGRLDLWVNFYRAFRAQVDREGKRRTVTVGGVGGNQEFPGKRLPRVQIHVSGVPVLFADVDVLTRHSIADSRLLDGRAGRDVFNAAAAFTIDFRRMQVSLSR
ncbi:MAG: pepsin/retropepsin-like aspartic protease family protein [Bryobacteraceae bacterium]|nr:pepsin/retropepsin-like aspartic protease family protein [Bryobacteraceae bacterium]